VLKNNENFEELYKENYNIVYGFLFSLCKNPELSEELTAETFYKALKNYKAFKGKSKISTWLCSIARNEYYTYYKKHSRLKSLEETDSLPDPDTIEEMVQDKTLALKIHSLLHEMDDPYKEVFILRVFAELSFKEIGIIMKKTEAWARVTYYRAKIKLLERMENNG